jgi:hypothetical protein
MHAPAASAATTPASTATAGTLGDAALSCGRLCASGLRGATAGCGFGRGFGSFGFGCAAASATTARTTPSTAATAAPSPAASTSCAEGEGFSAIVGIGEVRAQDINALIVIGIDADLAVIEGPGDQVVDFGPGFPFIV